MALHSTSVYKSDLIEYLLRRGYSDAAARGWCDDLMGRHATHISLAILLDGFFGLWEAGMGDREPLAPTVVEPAEEVPPEPTVVESVDQQPRERADQALQRFVKHTARSLGIHEILTGWRVVASRAIPGTWELEIQLMGAKPPMGLRLPETVDGFLLKASFRSVDH